MQQFDLTANVRMKSGKGICRKLRQKDTVPAILYGYKKDTIKLSINLKDIETILKKSKTSQTILRITVQDNGPSEVRPAMFKEIQTHPLTRDILHVDLYELTENRKIRVKIPVLTIGKCRGVEFGGLLQIIRREVEVSCLSNNIPESIILDVTDLDIGDSVHVKDIPAKEGVEIPAEVNFTILTVIGKKKEIAETEEEAKEEEVAAESE